MGVIEPFGRHHAHGGVVSALAAGAAVGWWDGVGAGDMSSWPLPPRSRVDPEPSEAYSEGYERFVALGDASVALLSPNSQ